MNTVYRVASCSRGGTDSVQRRYKAESGLLHAGLATTTEQAPTAVRLDAVTGEAHMDHDNEIEKQRQLVLEENRRLSNECEYTKDENRRLSEECEKWKRIAIPAVVVVIFGLVMRLVDGSQLNLWPMIGLVCVGLWISFARRGRRT